MVKGPPPHITRQEPQCRANGEVRQFQTNGPEQQYSTRKVSPIVFETIGPSFTLRLKSPTHLAIPMALQHRRPTADTRLPAAGRQAPAPNNQPVEGWQEEKRSAKVSRKQNGAIVGAIGGHHCWAYLKNEVLFCIEYVGYVG